MTLSQSLNDHLPIGWQCTAVINRFNYNDWEVTIKDEEDHYIMCASLSVEEAFVIANLKIQDRDYWKPSQREIEVAQVTSILSSETGSKLRNFIASNFGKSIDPVVIPPLKLPRPSFAPPSSPTTKA